MKIEVLPQAFSVCKVEDPSAIPLDSPFVFVGRTDRELSLACPTAVVPESTAAREDGWRAFRVAGELDFSLVGILARISDALAARGVSLFAVSTYDTDYVLVKQAKLADAFDALRAAGFDVAEA